MNHRDQQTQEINEIKSKLAKKQAEMFESIAKINDNLEEMLKNIHQNKDKQLAIQVNISKSKETSQLSEALEELKEQQPKPSEAEEEEGDETLSREDYQKMLKNLKYFKKL